MKIVGTVGEYTLIEEGRWAGTMDKDGNIHISPDMQYRSINDFVNGIAVAYQNEKWGLIDTEGNHISAFKYNYIQPNGEGYYRAEIGAKKNLLRSDGTEVLSVWVNDVYKVENGFFQIGITQRKTKTTPTRYLYGLANVNGDIIFPVIFDKIRWVDEDKEKLFYAELNGKPYLLTTTGSIYDPAQSHLPPKLELDHKALFEKFINWTLPGLQFFYRDTDAPIDAKYNIGDIVRAGFFVNATTKLLKPIHKTRFLIASAHAAMFCQDKDSIEQNPDVKRWNMCVFHFNSYFKVMDVYKKDYVTQIFLRHIPMSAAYFLGHSGTAINFINEAVGDEHSLVDLARMGLDQKMELGIHPLSLDKEWEKRTYHPIGLDNEFYPRSLDPIAEPTEGDTATMSSMVHRLAQDDDIEGFIIEDDNFPWRGL
ncbi:MAG: WG repeat-containing protein, partial [Rikenellaceae bacterium]